MVKGQRFTAFRDTGDPIMTTRVYNSQFVDELVFLDIDASAENRTISLDLIESVAYEARMPFAIGGGIQNVGNVRDIISAGADKVVITTAAVESPEVVSDAADAFGTQCVVAGIDVLRVDDRWIVCTHSGSQKTKIDFVEHIQNLDKLGAGEFFINSIDRDGMMQGYDLDVIKVAVESTDKPVVICGGAGNFQHLSDGLNAGAHAIAMASIFHFGDNNPPRARSFLKNAGFPMKVTK